MSVNIPNIDGSGPTGKIIPTGPATGGGGGTSTSPSSNPVVNLASLPTTGGLLGTSPAFIFIGFDNVAQTTLVYQLDTTNFNCEEPVEYDFKVEEAEIGNEVTIHRVLIRYRNIGICIITVAVISSEFQTPVDKRNATTITIGTSSADGLIYTAKADLKITTEAPQIKLFRAAKGGPMAITKVRVIASYGDGDII